MYLCNHTFRSDTETNDKYLFALHFSVLLQARWLGNRSGVTWADGEPGCANTRGVNTYTPPEVFWKIMHFLLSRRSESLFHAIEMSLYFPYSKWIQIV